MTTDSCMRMAALVCVACAYSTSAIAEPPPKINAVLDRLERRGDTVRSLQCDVVYRVEDLVSDDVRKSDGRITFKKKSPNPLFMITFRRTVFDGQVNPKKTWFLFDGRWFHEASERNKSVVSRDIAPPGTELDLFSIEKAPFPIPFGQKKAEILKHFNVTLSPPKKGDPDNCDHLVCIPKSDSFLAKDYTKLEFFVSRSLELPVRVVMTTNPADKVIQADFPGLSGGDLNVDIPDSAFRLPDQTKSYARTIE
jgi:hypothetical protein